MLPKIVVTNIVDRPSLVSRLGLSIGEMISCEGADMKVADFRSWINEMVEVLSSREGLSAIIWDADRLSWECQALLLKPLEEKREKIKIFLVVENENGLAATVLSRCEVVSEIVVPMEINEYWEKVLVCWKEGPGYILEYTSQLELVEAKKLVTESLLKLQKNLSLGVTEKRLLVMSLAIQCAADLEQKNINAKMAVADWLLESWRQIKTWLLRIFLT